MKLIIFIAILVLPSLVYSDCSAQNQKTAYENFKKAKSWEEYHAAYEKNFACIDGYISDEVAQTTVRLLTEEIGSAISFVIVDGDRKFSDFIINNVNEAITFSEYQMLASSINTGCANQDNYLCNNLTKKLEYLASF